MSSHVRWRRGVQRTKWIKKERIGVERESGVDELSAGTADKDGDREFKHSQRNLVFPDRIVGRSDV